MAMAMAVHDDDDWEYEYDDQEPEHHYITLDLTTHVPPTQAHDKKAKGPKTGRGSNKSLANAPGTSQLPIPQSSAPPASVPLSLSEPPQDDGASPQPQQEAPQPDRIQIVDLHGENPLVSHNNALYSCRWATDVGTSLFLTPPLTNTEPDHVPLRSTPSFDLLGATSARLIAIPATLKPRTIPLPPTDLRQGVPVTDKHSWATFHGDIVRESETEGVHIRLPSTASASRVGQARFLERLSAIKAQRGNKDNVPITNIKIYRHPEGWEAERDEWIAKETSLSEKNRLEAEIRAAKIASRDNRGAMVQMDDIQTDDNLSDQDLDTPDPDRIVLASQIPRKRKSRGGPRGGAPSGKKLRQSLGLPESRRDKRAIGRPRQLRLDSETAEGDDEVDAASASSHQGSAEPSTAGARDDIEEPV